MSRINELLQDLPDNLGKAPLDVYVDQSVDHDTIALLKARGWSVVDVRLEPDPVAYIEKYLDGVARGTIEPDDKRMKWFDAAMKARGINNRKESDIKPKETKKDISVQELFGIKKRKEDNLADMYKHPEKDQKLGRPKGAKDKTPRKKNTVLTGAALANKVRALRKKGRHAEAEKYIHAAATMYDHYKKPPKV